EDEGLGLKGGDGVPDWLRALLAGPGPEGEPPQRLDGPGGRGNDDEQQREGQPTDDGHDAASGMTRVVIRDGQSTTNGPNGRTDLISPVRAVIFSRSRDRFSPRRRTCWHSRAAGHWMVMTDSPTTHPSLLVRLRDPRDA